MKDEMKHNKQRILAYWSNKNLNPLVLNIDKK